MRLFVPFLFLGALIFSLSPSEAPKGRQKVALCTVATGKYARFVDPMIASARKYFCRDHDVTYFVFTDGEIEEGQDVVRIEQKRLGWPYDTLKRFNMYQGAREQLSKMDYIFAVDSDLVFEGPVGEEIFSKRVFTEHPGFVGKRGPYERSTESTARVGKKRQGKYFCGGVYGGSRKGFFHFIDTVIGLVDRDLAKGYIAVWHDESYLNRYCVDNPPTKVLSRAYCYPDGWDLPEERKIVVLDKDHEEVRK